MRACVACDTVHSPITDGRGEVGLLAAGDGGRVAWTDSRDVRQAAYVLVRDTRGQVRVVGKRGEGPGEFANVSGLSWRGDTLWVSDARLRRMQAFSSNGKFLAGYPVRSAGVFDVSASGTLIGWNVAPSAAGQRGACAPRRGRNASARARATARPDRGRRYVLPLHAGGSCESGQCKFVDPGNDLGHQP